MRVGRLLGTIRQQGTVKRTVIRGRVGARPAGMRLPPPMATQGTAPVQAPAASAAAEAKDDAKDNSETAAQEDDKVCMSIWLQELPCATISIRSCMMTFP